MQSRQFPRRIKLDRSVLGWPLTDIEAWVQNRISESNDQLT